MQNKPSSLEDLSDELLADIFSYFDGVDLFQSWQNLNERFNTLLHTLNTLQVTLSDRNPSTDTDIHLLAPSTYSLVTIGDVHIDLHLFPHLHRLVLQHPSSTLLQALSESELPCLKHLSVPDMLYGMSSIYQSIFSNTFPRLASCHLFGFETIETILPWTQTPSLRVLKIGFIDFHVYKAILSACPNLHTLQLKMFQSYLKLSDIREHSHLRQLEVHSEITDWRYSDQLLDMFLACATNLERLSISRTISASKIVELISDYDWLASIIAVRLPILQHLHFYLHLEYHFECVHSINAEVRDQLKRCFVDAHHKRYQARLAIE